MSNVISLKDYINKKNQEASIPTKNSGETYLEVFSRLTVEFIDQPHFRNKIIGKEEFIGHFDRVINLPDFSKFKAFSNPEETIPEMRDRRETAINLWAELDFALSNVIKVNPSEHTDLREAFIEVFTGMHELKNLKVTAKKESTVLGNPPELIEQINNLPKTNIEKEMIKTQSLEEYKELCVRVVKGALDQNTAPPFKDLIYSLEKEAALSNISWIGEAKIFPTDNFIFGNNADQTMALNSTPRLSTGDLMILGKDINQVLITHPNSQQEYWDELLSALSHMPEQSKPKQLKM